MSKNKTPNYTLKAIKRYNQKIVRKSVNINIETEPELVEAIEKDKTSFSGLCKELLRKHYNL